MGVCEREREAFAGEFLDANVGSRPGGIFLGGKLSYADEGYKQRYESPTNRRLPFAL